MHLQKGLVSLSGNPEVAGVVLIGLSRDYGAYRGEETGIIERLVQVPGESRSFRPSMIGAAGQAGDGDHRGAASRRSCSCIMNS